MNRQEFASLFTEEVLSGKRRFSWWRVLRQLVAGKPQNRVVTRLRLAQWLRAKRASAPAWVLRNGLAHGYGVYVGPSTVIGKGVHFPHPTSVVIGDRLVLGKRCKLYQQITLEGAVKSTQGVRVRLGDDVVVYPGAKVIGEGRVGNNVIIGANSVVNRPFGDNLVLAGAPARVIKTLAPRSPAVPASMQ